MAPTIRPNRSDIDAEALAFAMGDAFEAPPPERKPSAGSGRPWQPKLGPIGTSVLLNRKSGTKFMYGERGSLKTGIAIHDLILHAYQDFQPGKLAPLAIICTIVRSAATEGGAWEKLNTLYLPEWHDGIGLEFTEPKMDDQKNRYVFISNKHGGWSRIVLKSIPHGESIRARFKGLEPSYVLFDEITETDNPDYYLVPSQGLRRPTGGPRQFVCTGNPPDEGTEHWTWKVLIQGPAERNGHKEAVIPQGGGRLIGPPDEISTYHIPLSENVYWSAEEKKAYQAKLMQEAILDPTAEDRLIKGIWTARPRGQGLFKEYFIPTIHVKGNAVKRHDLMPSPGWPITLGYDLGQVFSSVTFLQNIPTKERNIWIAIDEIDYLGHKILYKKLAWDVIRRMLYWQRVLLRHPDGTFKPYPFQFRHITDESAINQWRPGGDGSYDAWEFEREYNRVAERLLANRKMKMMGAPKGAGSVPARVRMLQAKLYNEEFFASARCKNLIDMLMFLEADKEDPEKPRRSKWVHKFDSTTYPMFRDDIVPRGNSLQTQEHTPTLIHCGTLRSG